MTNAIYHRIYPDRTLTLLEGLYYKFLTMYDLLFKNTKNIIIILFLLLKIPPLAAENNNLLVYAAASTNTILIDIQKRWKKNNDINIRISSASSSALAKQIISGAPANIYISASWEWVKEIKKLNLLDDNYVVPLFENKLVLIAPINSPTNYINILNTENLTKLFKEKLINSRISIADPTHVPAGIYTKQALIKLNIWKQLNKTNMAWGGDVRRALKFVALGNSPLGIVYHTDAITEPKVKIIGEFNNALHSPIQYWATIININKNTLAKSFINYLKSDHAKKIYAKHGFINLEKAK